MYFELIEVEHWGRAACGPPIPFKPRGRVRIPRPLNAKPHDTLVVVNAHGRSMEAAGIFHLDMIVCKVNVSLDDIESGKLLLIEHKNSLMIKKFAVDHHGTITFNACSREQAAHEPPLYPHLGSKFKGVLLYSGRHY